MKIRWHLIRLVASAVLPVILFAGGIIVRLGRQEQLAVDRGLLDTARALSLAVDRELEASIRTLQALGTSKHLDSSDLRQFYEQSDRVLQAQARWSTIVLFDSSARQVLNLLRPFGSSLPAEPPNDPGVKNTVELGHPVVSNLFMSRIAAEPRIAVNVPVIRAGKVEYVLGANFSTSFLLHLLRQQHVPDDRFAMIVDRNKVVVARTGDPEKFTGKSATKHFFAETRPAKETTRRGTTLDGTDVYMAAIRSDFTGWSVVLEAPIAIVQAPMRHTLLFVAVGGIMLALGLLLAVRLGRRVSDSIGALADSTKSLGNGSIPRLSETPVAEVNEVGRVIVDAALSRKHMEETLQKSEQRFQLVAQATNDVLWDWDLATNRVWWNEGASVLFGYSTDEIEPGIEWWKEHIHPEDRKKIVPEIDAVVHGGDKFWTGEYRYRRHDGSYVHVLDRGYVMYDSHGNPVRMVGAMVDITARLKLEQERAGYIEQLRALAQASLSINSLQSLDETLEIVTHKAREIICAHQAVSSMTRQNWAQAITAVSFSDKYRAYEHFDAKPDGSGIYAVVCEKNRPMRMTQAELEAHPRWRGFGHYAGQHPPLRGWLAVPLIGRDGRNIGLLQVSDKYEGDFTETDEALLVQFAQLAAVAIENAQLFKEVDLTKEQLQHLSHRLVNIQEAERRAIARELHDEIGQALTGIKFAVEASMRKRPEWQPELGDVRAQTNELIGRVQDLSLELRPSVLDDFGLLPALLWQQTRCTTQMNLNVEFQHAGVEGRRFEPELEIAAYRIVQEALTNVARHAKVGKVEMEVSADANTLRISIKDEGVGFDPSTVAASTGVGLSGMRERAAMSEGWLRIDSSPGHGTLLTAELPLKFKLSADHTNGNEPIAIVRNP